MTLLINRARVNTAQNATLNDVLAVTSVTSCDCTNTISPTFTTSTGDYNVSSDTTAPGVNSLTNLVPTFINDDPAQGISQAWADANLKDGDGNGLGWNLSVPVAWAIVDDSGGGQTPTPTNYVLNLPDAEQLNQAGFISLSLTGSTTLSTVEQHNTVSSMVIANPANYQLILSDTEQHNNVQTITLNMDTATAQGLSVASAEQQNESQIIHVTQSGVLGGLVAEQLAHFNLTKVTSTLTTVLAPVEQINNLGLVELSANLDLLLATAQQVNETNTISLTDASTTLLALSTVEQHNDCQTLAISALSLPALATTEQVNQATSIELTHLGLITIGDHEQINEALTLFFAQDTDLQTLAGLTLTPVSPQFTLIFENTTYTLKEN